jgi:tetratricopeptide (TPR) repeat protein
MGNCYVVLNELDLAEDAFKQAVSLSSSVYPALNLAALYSRQGRVPEAEDVLTKAIRRTPLEGDGYYGLAIIRFEQGRLEEAEQLGLQAHQHLHRVADVHLLLGRIYLRQEKAESVVRELRLYVAEAKPSPARDRVMKLLDGAK